MPNWVSHRLVLSGPQAELERFQQTCIRPTLDNVSDEKSLDLGALVPMPPVIATTLDDCSPAAKQAAFEATGFESWYEWRIVHWGCKWNVSSFSIITVSTNLLDVAFATPWSVPEPALAALAAQFPLLSGRVCAVEPDMDWGLIGTLQGGTYTSTSLELSPELTCLVCGWAQHPEIRLKTGLGLVEHAAHAKELNNTVVASIWTNLVGTLAPEHAARLSLSFDVQRFKDWSDTDRGTSNSEVEFCSLNDVVQDPLTLSFFLADGRCSSVIDRQLMSLLAEDILAKWDHEPDPMQVENDLRRSVAFLLFEHREDDLRKWAFHAAFRPGATIDFASLTSLQDSFLQYAVRMRQRILQHLEVIQEWKLHQSGTTPADDECRWSQVMSQVALTLDQDALPAG